MAFINQMSTVESQFLATSGPFINYIRDPLSLVLIKAITTHVISYLIRSPIASSLPPQNFQPALTVFLSLNLLWFIWDLRPAKPSYVSKESLGSLTKLQALVNEWQALQIKSDKEDHGVYSVRRSLQ